MQAAAGGQHVRVVIQDGKTFKPSNASGARRHLKKLAEEAQEMARIHGGEARAAAAEAAAEVASKALGQTRRGLSWFWAEFEGDGMGEKDFKRASFQVGVHRFWWQACTESEAKEEEATAEAGPLKVFTFTKTESSLI